MGIQSANEDIWGESTDKGLVIAIGGSDDCALQIKGP